MTIASLTKTRICDHERNALIYEDFATTAADDGKVYMAHLYRSIASGHRARIEALQDQLTRLEPLMH